MGNIYVIMIRLLWSFYVIISMPLEIVTFKAVRPFSSVFEMRSSKQGRNVYRYLLLNESLVSGGSFT